MSDQLPDDVIDAHLPDGASPHVRWFLRRFAGSVVDSYRTMDPLLAQVVTTPAVRPVESFELAD